MLVRCRNVHWVGKVRIRLKLIGDGFQDTEFYNIIGDEEERYLRGWT